MKEFWDERFAETGFAYGEAPNRYFAETLEGRTPGRLFLPGEGEGRNAVYAAKLGWDVMALDYSESGRRKALELAEKSNVSIQYLIGDVAEIPSDIGMFDMVFVVFLHLPPTFRKVVHRKLASMMAPGGTLAMEVFSKEQLSFSSGGPQKEEMLYSPDDLRADFDGFDITYLQKLETELAEGKYHNGPASVIRLIAQKQPNQRPE